MTPQGRPGVGPTGGTGLAVRFGAADVRPGTAEVGLGTAEVALGAADVGFGGIDDDPATVAGNGTPAAELATGTGADPEATELPRDAAGWWCAVQPEIISASPAARTTHRFLRLSFTAAAPRVEATSQRDAGAR